MEKEQQFLSLVSMIASELGYIVKWVQLPDREAKEILVLERENSHFYSFLGGNKVQVALQWLRQQD